MFSGIFSWLIIGFVIYLMFSRRGGMMGCCGGHDHHSPQDARHAKRDNRPSTESPNDIIDLKEGDYRVVKNDV